MREEELEDKIAKINATENDTSAFKDREAVDSTGVNEKENANGNTKETEESADTRTDIEREMDNLNLSKDDVLDMVLEIIENGKYTEDFSAIGGKIKFRLESVKMNETRAFISAFEELNPRVDTTATYYFNIYTVAMVLKEFQGESTGDSLEARKVYIEANVPSPLFSILLREANSFGRKVGIISHPEVATFF